VSSDEELYQPLTRSERRFDPCDDEPERPPESWRGTRHEPVERDLFARLLGDLYDVDVDDREVSLDG
jgi:hypothetical protein